MRLNVYLTPAEVTAVPVSPNDIYIVIDVIRATTSLTVMLDRGAARILAADTLEQAQEAAKRVPGRLLCGERHARPLPGFDYGNSPVEFSQADISGRELILTTTNGTRAFYPCPQDSIRLAGCFYNARAVTSLALQLAQERGSNIALVCAGEAGYYALDDSTCAGYLVLELLRQYPSMQVHESVYAAIALYETYKPPKLLDLCDSARSVRDAGLADDLDMCMQANGSTSVPAVAGMEPKTGLLVIERFSGKK